MHTRLMRKQVPSEQVKAGGHPVLDVVHNRFVRLTQKVIIAGLELEYEAPGGRRKQSHRACAAAAVVEGCQLFTDLNGLSHTELKAQTVFLGTRQTGQCMEMGRNKHSSNRTDTSSCRT